MSVGTHAQGVTPVAPGTTLILEPPGMALARASHAIFGTRDVERLPEVIVREAMQVMSAATASLMLPGVDGSLYIAHAYGLDPEIQKTTRIAVGQGIAGRVAESQQPMIIAGGRRDGDDSGLRRHGRAASSIVYPIVSGGQLVGLLTFNRIDERIPYIDADLGIVSVFAAQVMLALDNVRFFRQSVSSEKLAAVGALAAGIAHEINTPMQFIGDNVQFVKEGLDDLFALVEQYRSVCLARGASEDDLRILEQERDLDYLRERMPKSLASAVEGVNRVNDIVRTVKSLAHPSTDEKVSCDLNMALRDAIVVSGGEHKTVAAVVTNFGDVPHVSGYPGELNQVFLNLIVNAAHAIASAKATGKTSGTITIETRREGSQVVVVIRDDGCGIREQIRERIFEPFFTTKGVGRGTGLGLSIARTIIVDRHGGSLSVESEVGRGTAFQIKLHAE